MYFNLSDAIESRERMLKSIDVDDTAYSVDTTTEEHNQILVASLRSGFRRDHVKSVTGSSSSSG